MKIASKTLLATALVLAPATAAARMPEAQRAAVMRDVAKARAADPRPFAAVSRIMELAPDAVARARDRKAPIAQYVARLGPSAVLPALERIVEGRDGELRRELVEAVGLVRDPRATGVLGAIVDDASEDRETTRTATEALARIGTEEAARRIVTALDAARDERARAILEGMGECRRAFAVDALAARLRATNDEADARVAARSLGRAGNAWAWRTLADRAEEDRVREIAARALVDAFVRHRGEARDAAANALMVVGDPRTPAMIGAARSAASTEADRAALDELRARFAKNPAAFR
ncbi:MAG: hypothetical protein KF819_32305 [Labilithrix sp.]|nr:hypothetical protein [Labilithrix sp.]